MTFYYLYGKKPFAYNGFKQLMINRIDLKDLLHIDPEISHQ
jgi:hypothetical protein